MSREAPVNKEKQALQEMVPKAREAHQREKSLLPLVEVGKGQVLIYHKNRF